MERSGAAALSLEQYRLLVEKSSRMIWRSDTDGKRDYFNAAWLDFTGRPVEEELGDGWRRDIHPEDRQRCAEVSLEDSRRREPFQREYRLRRHDGVYRYVSDRGDPYFEKGEFRGFLGGCLDVQESRRSETAGDRFLRLITHELRTPLQAAKIFVELVRRNTVSGRPNAPEIFDKLSLQLDRFGRLIADLSESGRVSDLRMSFEEFDLGELVERLPESGSTALSLGAARQRHTVRLDRGGLSKREAARVRGDRHRLEQVFANLLDNAVKYSPRGGVIEVSLDSDERWHRLSVRDRGIGIPSEELPLVTRRFFRASNASSDHYPGLGLGLSLARDIVERHGGTLAIESRLGEGTRATVSLPRDLEAAS